MDVAGPALLLGIVVLGCALRLHDPLSTPVIGAEDPYTHLVLTKEALARGWFGGSQWLGGTGYPPGLHALGGVLAADSGTPLETWVMFAPIAFGALAIVGTFALANKLSGPVAGLVAALLVAVMPEHIFRTELYFPTALDMAMIPAYLLAFVLATESGASRSQQGGAIALFAVLTAALAFAHPWVVPLMLVPAAIWLALRVLREGAPFEPSLRRLLPGAIMVVLGASFAIASRWDHTDSGFASFFDHLGPLRVLSALSLPGVLLFPVFVVVLGLVAAPGVLLVAGLARVRLSRPTRIALGIACAAVALAAVQLLARTPQPGVNYRNMLGRVALDLGLAGLAVAFIAPSSLGDLGVGLCAFTYPLTALNVFNSSFWPQRTVVYLSLGVALLAGAAVATVVGALLAWRPLRAPRRASWIAPVASIAAVLLVAGAVQAAPAHPYPWYRLYTNAEYSLIKDTNAMVDKDPGARIIVYSWQPGLFLKATGNPDQVRYCPDCYRDEAQRSAAMSESHGALYAVVDKYTDKDAQKGKADESWLSGARLVSQAGQWRVYQVR